MYYLYDMHSIAVVMVIWKHHDSVRCLVSGVHCGVHWKETFPILTVNIFVLLAAMLPLFLSFLCCPTTAATAAAAVVCLCLCLPAALCYVIDTCRFSQE